MIRSQELQDTLERFIESADFINICIENTRSGGGGKSNRYRVKLFHDGEWGIGYSGNKWKTQGLTLELPYLDYHRHDLMQYIEDGAGDEDSFLFELYCDQEKELKDTLRLRFQRKTNGEL